MSDFSEQKRNLISVFGNIVRVSPIGATVNMQRTLVAMHQVAEATGEGQPVDLAPIHHYLIEVEQCDKMDVAEMFVYLRSRAEQMGLLIELPPQYDSINEATAATIIERFQEKLQPQKALYEKKDTPLPPGASADEPKKSKRSPYGKKGKKKPGPSRGLLITFGVVCAIGAGGFLFLEKTREPPPKPIQGPAKGGLPCSSLTIFRRTALCEIPKATFDRLVPSEFKRMHRATKDKAELDGAVVLLVRTPEDGKYHFVR